MKPVAALVEAEERLRAVGLTGSQAFDALMNGVLARLGDDVPVRPEAEEAVACLDPDAGIDLLGLAYERFFADLFKGRRGQYFTPRPLVELLLDLAGVGKGTRVLDPTCGSGGFVVCAARRGARVRGIELDPYLVRLARLNLRLAGVRGQIEQADFFASRPEPVDVMVANPPFSVPVTDPDVLGRYELGRGRERVLSDWLFIEAMERHVRPDGRAAIVFPWSVLDNPSTQPLRDRLEAHWRVESIVALPEGVFRPFGGAAGRAVLLILERDGTGFTRWAEIRDPGWDVRSVHLKATPGADLAELRAGRGWQWLPSGAWTPASTAGGRRLGELAHSESRTVKPATELMGEVDLVELADGDRRSGELHPRRVEAGSIRGSRQRIRPGDLLVARMRPELGNVVVARGALDGTPMVGSPEWIPLTAEAAPHWLLHVLRSPTWRNALPLTRGQTRPRTHVDGVLDSRVPWPDDEVVDRVDVLSRRIHAERAVLRERLDSLQALVDALVSGEIDLEVFEAALSDLERLPG